MPGPRRYRVEWTDSAKGDIRSIFGYLSDEDPFKAERIVVRLKRKADSLKTLPSRGRVVPELALQGVHEHREMIYHPWRIVYQLRGRSVRVVAVIDGRRDVEDLLFARLLV